MSTCTSAILASRQSPQAAATVTFLATRQSPRPLPTFLGDSPRRTGQRSDVGAIAGPASERGALIPPQAGRRAQFSTVPLHEGARYLADLDHRGMKKPDLPAELVPAFTLAEGREAGLDESKIRSRRFRTPFHGTRAVRDLSDFARLQLLMRAVPPHAFASGRTAGVVHGVPLPSDVQRDAFGRPTIAVPHPRNRIRGRGVLGKSLRISTADIVVRRGIRVTSPSRTWLDLSAELDLPALVAVTDFLISRRRRRCTKEALVAEHAASPRAPGARNRRLALELCSDSSESPRESEVRCVLEMAGLPRPDCNVNIYDGARFVARVDIIYREQRLVVEYYGDYHRDPDQWSRDEMRRAELESLGYRVTVVTRRDFDDLKTLAARIGRLLAA